MKQYPKIPNTKDAEGRKHFGDFCFAFYKYDGSCLRFEWSKKRGWFKFGTRRRLFDQTDKDFGCAIEVFMQNHAEDLERVFRDNKNYNRFDKFVVFAEFFGPNSFAGLHKVNDPKELRIIDVAQIKKGIIGPKQFIKDFGHLNIAELIYQGKMTGNFTQGVRDGKYPVDEGVVCKGGEDHKLWMMKIKTTDYLKRLKEVFQGNEWKNYWE